MPAPAFRFSSVDLVSREPQYAYRHSLGRVFRGGVTSVVMELCLYHLRATVAGAGIVWVGSRPRVRVLVSRGAVTTR